MSFELPLQYLFLFLFVSARVSGLVLIAPGFGAGTVPMRVRALFILALSLLIAPLQAVDSLATPTNLGQLVWLMGNEIGVGVLLGFVGHECHMHTTQHHGDVPCAEVVGQFVGAGRSAGDEADADQIGVGVEIHIGDALVHEDDFGVEFGGNERSQRGQRQRRVAQRLAPRAAAVTVERSARGDEQNAQRVRVRCRHRRLQCVGTITIVAILQRDNDAVNHRE